MKIYDTYYYKRLNKFNISLERYSYNFYAIELQF